MKNEPLQQFRQSVYHILPKRADTILNLVDALTTAKCVTSLVALSESPLFKRKFSAIYEALEEGEMPLQELADHFHQHQPTTCETIAGYELYALDCTSDPRPEAETLPGRLNLKSQAHQKSVPGEKFSWLVRLVKSCTSWVAPQDIQRVTQTTTDSAVGAEQIRRLEQQSDRPKVIVADSLYGNQYFLAIFLVVTTVFALVRLRSNLTLYESPLPKKPHQKGRPPIHGKKFLMKNPSREPDRQATCILFGQTVVLAAWHGLHLQQLPTLVGMLLRVQFLKTDGTPRYKNPIFLFWTGPLSVSLEELCRMYLWRFAIEHAFRFFKQRLGLTCQLSTNPESITHWIWIVALAYWQLLLMEPSVGEHRPAWYPRPISPEPWTHTPGIVQRASLPFLLELGTPAKPPQPAGKGRGRAVGYHPKPKERFPVVYKTKKKTKSRSKQPKTVI